MFKVASSSCDSKGRFFLSSCCNFGVVIGRSALVHSPVISLHIIYRHVKSVPGVFWNEGEVAFTVTISGNSVHLTDLRVEGGRHDKWHSPARRHERWSP